MSIYVGVEHLVIFEPSQASGNNSKHWLYSLLKLEIFCLKNIGLKGTRRHLLVLHYNQGYFYQISKGGAFEILDLF